MSLFFCALSHATTFIERPFPEALKDAPIVVRGQIGMSYSDWAQAEDGSRRLYTFSQLQVEEVLRGRGMSSVPSTLVIRELGGKKDGTVMEVSGTARFERGESVVVFLGGGHPDGSYDMRGMTMGKYTVERDANGHEVLRGAGLSGKRITLGEVRDLVAKQDRTSAKPFQQSTPQPTLLVQKNQNQVPPDQAVSTTTPAQLSGNQAECIANGTQGGEGSDKIECGNTQTPQRSQTSKKGIYLVLSFIGLGVLWWIFRRSPLRG